MKIESCFIIPTRCNLTGDWGLDTNFAGGHTRTDHSTIGNLSPFYLRQKNSPFYPDTFRNNAATGNQAIKMPVFEITNPLNNNYADKYCSVENGINCTGFIYEADVPFQREFAERVAQDSINYPEDSLIYRWWSRRALYYMLLEQDSIVEADPWLCQVFRRETWHEGWSEVFRLRAPACSIQ